MHLKSFHALPPLHKHLIVQTGVSLAAGSAFVAHIASPEIEAIAATVGSLAAIWGVDLERIWRDRALRKVKVELPPRKRGYRGSRRRALALSTALTTMMESNDANRACYPASGNGANRGNRGK